jgi:hypothetical protein
MPGALGNEFATEKDFQLDFSRGVATSLPCRWGFCRSLMLIGFA